MIAPADAMFAATLNANYENVVLRLDLKALERKLAALIDAPVAGPLQFEPLLEFSTIHAMLLRNHFFMLVDIIGTAAAPLPKPVQLEFEQAIVVMFLHASRHNYSHSLGADMPNDVFRLRASA